MTTADRPIDFEHKPFYIFIGGRGEDEHDVMSHWGSYIQKINPNGDKADLGKLLGSNWQVYTWQNPGNLLGSGDENNTFTATPDEAQSLRADIGVITDSGRNDNQVILIGDSKGGALTMEYLAEIAEDPANHPAQHVIGAAAIDALLGLDAATLGAGFHRYQGELVVDANNSAHFNVRDRLANLQDCLSAAGMHDVHLATVDRTLDPFSSSQLSRVAHFQTPFTLQQPHGSAREDPNVVDWVLSEVSTGEPPQLRLA